MDAEINKQKFESFFRTEYKKLINYVRKNVEERFFGSTPEDIVQDVALNLLSKLDFDHQIENLGNYIYRSLRNKTIDVNRQKVIPESTDKPDADKLLNFSLASLPDEPEYDFLKESGITVEQIYESISRLKPDEEAIIMLTEFEGRSFAELSEKWDIPIGTLLSRKHRALAKLYKLLVNTDKTKTKQINEYGNKRKILSKQQVAQ
jgi:RNA polymerase sigma-70 factor (ECF subfamily)